MVSLLDPRYKYTGLLIALQEAIPIMNLLNEMATLGFIPPSHPPNVICKVFEDNSGALQMANVHKYTTDEASKCQITSFLSLRE